ncbi:MAG TPA: Ig-like domain-containing protein [Iamia sp.]
MGIRRTMMAALAAVVGLGLVGPPAGAAVPPPAKSIVVTSSPSTAVWSEGVRLTVAITPKGGGTPKGGTVTFLDGDVPIGTATATARNTTLTTSSLAVGGHQITAAYGGDETVAPGSSAPITVTVAKASATVTLTSESGPVGPGAEATLRAVVKPAAPAATSRRPSGTVVFNTGTRSATVRLNANGVATWRPTTLAEGSHTVTATYGGSDVYDPSTSTSVVQEVVVETPNVLDQETTAAPLGAYNVYGGETQWLTLAQTFTAGITGELDEVTLRLWQDSEPLPLEVEIRTLSAGVPTTTVLGSGSVDWTEVDVWDGSYQETHPTPSLDVELDVPASVTAGTEYALVLRSEATNGTWLPGLVEPTYPGTLLLNTEGSTWWPMNDYDMWFRTWVVPAP